jgi:hypothetical protein
MKWILIPIMKFIFRIFDIIWIIVSCVCAIIWYIIANIFCLLWSFKRVRYSELFKGKEYLIKNDYNKYRWQRKRDMNIIDTFKRLWKEC